MPIKLISEELVQEISRSYPDLKLLNLSNNEIAVVENLAPLTALERLNLSGVYKTYAQTCVQACVQAYIHEWHTHTITHHTHAGTNARSHKQEH